MARGPEWIRRGIAGAAAVGLLGLIGASGAGAQGKFPVVDQPGVTDKEIRVAALYTDKSDPTNGKNEDSVGGAKAYFDYINKTKGGVYGRKLVIGSEHDDELANNRAEIQSIISGGDAFAALPVAVLVFSGAQLLEDAGMPTFGWQTSDEWGSTAKNPGPSNFFGDAGGFYCIDCVNLKPENLISKKLGLKKIGVVAYGVPQSAACANGIEKTFAKYPTGKVVFADKSVPFGTADYSAQVAQMKDAGVDLVYPCIDGQANVLLAKEMTKQGLDAVIVAPSLYNAELVKENAQFLEGDYVNTNFAPLETKPKPEGLKLYDTWVKKTGGARNQNSIVGWINADLFVEGLKAAGPDFTQKKVVDAINQMTDYQAKGLLPGVNWTVAHEHDKACFALVKIHDGKFQPAFAKPNHPFFCLPDRLKKVPANPPDGSNPADRY